MFFHLSTNPQGSAFSLSGSSVLPLFISGGVPAPTAVFWLDTWKGSSKCGPLSSTFRKGRFTSAHSVKRAFPLLGPFPLEVGQFFFFFQQSEQSSVERRENQTTTRKLASKELCHRVGQGPRHHKPCLAHLDYCWIMDDLVKVPGFSGS